MVTTTTYYRWEREVLSKAEAGGSPKASSSVTFAELQASKQASCNVSERSATISHVRLCVVRFDGYHPEIFAIFPMFNSALHALFLKIQTFFFHYKWPVHNANIHGHHILAKESKKRQLQPPHEKNSDNGRCVSSGEAIP